MSKTYLDTILAASRKATETIDTPASESPPTIDASLRSIETTLNKPVETPAPVVSDSGMLNYASLSTVALEAIRDEILGILADRQSVADTPTRSGGGNGRRRGGKTITLKYAATCADCGADLYPGENARYYSARKIYGLSCH